MKNTKPDRWTLLRDIGVLQIKLFVDGLRDLILVPLSIGAGVLSLLQRSDGPGTQFYDLLRAGRSSDRWINLFGAAERVHGQTNDDAVLPIDDIDEMVSRVELFILDEYNTGVITGETRARLEKAFAGLREKARNDES